ncbi:MAG: phospholipid carrier-dependent glycosyltransferase [Anaerolineae bacterium]|nr:MAG: phospholipid carrier-dependent glycosyltransferase [Anaerolineae bacterium]
MPAQRGMQARGCGLRRLQCRWQVAGFIAADENKIQIRRTLHLPSFIMERCLIMPVFCVAGQPIGWMWSGLAHVADNVGRVLFLLGGMAILAALVWPRLGSLPRERVIRVMAVVRKELTAPAMATGLATFCFLFLLVWPMLEVDQLYGADVWRHYFYTRFGETREFYSDTVETLRSTISDAYPTTLRSNMYLFSTLLGDDPYLTVRYFSTFLRAVFFLLVYAVVQIFTGERRWAALGVVLMMSSYNFVWRSTQTWPENQALLMYLLALYGFERNRQTGEKPALVLVGIALVGVIYNHPPSLYTFLAMAGGYGLVALLNRNWTTIKQYAVLAMLALLLALPVANELFNPFSTTLVNNLGENSLWAPYAREQARYDPVQTVFFQEQLGSAMIILAALGLLAARSDSLRERLPLVVLVLFGFALSVSTHFSFYIPPIRAMSYLTLPMIPLAIIGARAASLSLSARGLRALLVGVVALAGLVMVLNTPPYFTYTRGEITMGQAVNARLAADPGISVGFLHDQGIEVLYLLNEPGAVCFNVLQQTDGHYDDKHAPPEDVRCVDPTLILVNRNLTRALPGYALILEDGIYGLWERRR